MKWKLVVLLSTIALGVAGFLFGQPDSEQTDLEQRITALEQSVESLKDELAEIRSELNAMRTNNIKILPGRPPNLPPGTSEHEFGGIKFYMVPLDEKSVMPQNRKR